MWRLLLVTVFAGAAAAQGRRACGKETPFGRSNSWIAYLYLNEQYLCNGYVIHPSFILTSAQCVRNVNEMRDLQIVFPQISTQLRRNPSTFRRNPQHFPMKSFKDESQQADYNVDDIAFHPDMLENPVYYPAILHIVQPVIETQFVGPVCLSDTYEGDVIYVSGGMGFVQDNTDPTNVTDYYMVHAGAVRGRYTAVWALWAYELLDQSDQTGALAIEKGLSPQSDGAYFDWMTRMWQCVAGLPVHNFKFLNLTDSNQAACSDGAQPRVTQRPVQVTTRREVLTTRTTKRTPVTQRPFVQPTQKPDTPKPGSGSPDDALRTTTDPVPGGVQGGTTVAGSVLFTRITAEQEYPTTTPAAPRLVRTTEKGGLGTTKVRPQPAPQPATQPASQPQPTPAPTSAPAPVPAPSGEGFGGVFPGTNGGGNSAEASCPQPDTNRDRVWEQTFGTSLVSGAMIKFRCLNGKRLVGNSIIVCQSTGRWNSDYPLCWEVAGPSGPTTSVSESVDASLQNVCRPLKAPTNGAFTTVSAGTTSQLVEGTIIRFSCRQGYQLKGNEATICVAQQWTYPVPVCEQRGCLRPSLTDGKFKLFQTTSVSLDSTELSFYAPGTLLTSRCEPDYYRQDTRCLGC